MSADKWHGELRWSRDAVQDGLDLSPLRAAAEVDERNRGLAVERNRVFVNPVGDRMAVKQLLNVLQQPDRPQGVGPPRPAPRAAQAFFGSCVGHGAPLSPPHLPRRTRAG